MRKIFILALTLLIACVLIGSALAVPSGKNIEYQGGAMGKVTFDGKKHADTGSKCNDCHPQVFQMKKGATRITMAEHKPGKSCGVCHDGTKAFKQQGACNKCHIK